MKKIFNILIVSVFIGGFLTSCDNDDNNIPTLSAPVKIMSQQTSFPAAASTGSIVVDATAPISVTSSDQGWVSTSVEGNVITINVEENPSLDGRSSTLTITCGEAKSDISVIQAGVIFDLGGVVSIPAGNDATTFTYELKSNCSFNVNSDANWIEVESTDNGLVVKLDANNSGHVRRGNVTYTAGSVEGSIPVVQADFADNIAGEYMFAYTNSKTGKVNYFNSILKGTESDCSIDIPALGFSIPVTYDNKTASIRISAGSYIGDYSEYKAHITLWDIDEGYLSWASAVSMDAPFDYYEDEDGTGITEAEFQDNGSFTGYTVSAIRFEAFTSMTLNSNTRAGSLLDLIYPFLMRIHSTPAAVTQTEKFQNRVSKLSKNAVPVELSSLSPIVKDNLRTR